MYREAGEEVIRTRCLDEIGIVFPSQERVRQVTEELLQKTSHAVNIVEEVVGVPEVELRRRRIYSRVSTLTEAPMSDQDSNSPVSNMLFSLFTCGTDPDSR